jgi:hypothetical protein
MNKLLSLTIICTLVFTSQCQHSSEEGTADIIEGLLFGALEVEIPDILLCGYDIEQFGE